MNPLEREADSLRRALAGLSEVHADGKTCPDTGLIWDSAAERLSSRRNAAVIRHIGECTACAVAWDLARDLSAVEERPAEVHAAGVGWMPLAAAALVVVAIAVGALLIPRGSEPPVQPDYRDVAADWLVSEVPEDVALQRDSLVLHWSAGPGGTTYDVSVTDGSLQPLARAFGLDAPKFSIDPQDVAGVQPGGRILWRVTAHLPDNEIVVSMTFINTVE